MVTPIKYVADRAHYAWRTSHSKGLIARIFRLIGAANPADVIYVAEHEAGNWDTAQCVGDPVRVWAYRGDEFEQLDAVGELDQVNAIASRTPVIRYCLDENGQRMIHTEWNGRRAGYGHIMRRVGEDWKSEGRSWIS